jgi:hypothetical protein
LRLEGLDILKEKKNDLIGNRTRNLPACSLASQTLAKLTAEVYSAEGQFLLQEQTLTKYIRSLQYGCYYSFYLNTF